MTLTQLTATRASSAVVLIRLYVGLIFAGEGVLKFLRSDALGPGRFIKSGIPAGTASPTWTVSLKSVARC